MAAERLEAGERGGEAISLEAGGRKDGEVEAWGHEKTELEARVMRVRGRKAWKDKIKREKDQELEEIRRLGKVHTRCFRFHLQAVWGRPLPPPALCVWS